MITYRSTPALSWAQVLRWNHRDWAVVVGFTLLINLLMLTPTLYMLQIYDRVIVSGSGLTLLAVTLVVLFLFVLTGLADGFRSRLLIRIGQLMDQRLSPAVFQATLRERLQGEAPDVGPRMADLTRVRQFLTGPGFLALMDMPWIPIYLGVLFLLHPVLGWFAVGFALLQWGLAALTHHRAQQLTDANEKNVHAVDQLTHQFRRLGPVVTVMGMGPTVSKRWAHTQTQARLADEQVLSHQARWGAFSKWLRYTQQSASLGLGAWLAIRGEITLGAMIAGNVMTTRALAPIDAWAQTRPVALAAKDAMARLALLLTPVPAVSAQEAHAGHAAVGSGPADLIRLHHVDVRVGVTGRHVLKGISLVFRPGEITAIQGPSGSGKTTLLKVLLGIQPTAAGQVQRQLNPTTQGDAVGYLPQAIELFDGTVAQNIARFAQPDSNAVIAAAQLTGLHETLQRLDQGYDTPIGPHGQALSGGQRQRIGLARAVYGQPALVVLDEPNAQLDSAGEAALYQAMRRLRDQGACVVVVSHRPGAAAMADQSIHLEQGAVVSCIRTLPKPP